MNQSCGISELDDIKMINCLYINYFGRFKITRSLPKHCLQTADGTQETCFEI